jgi:aminopeptidase N
MCNKLTIPFLFVLLLVQLKTLAQPTDSIKELPPAYQVRVQKIDVKHIALNLQFDWNKKQAYGTATITLAPLIAANTILLDAAQLTIHSIKLPDAGILQFTYDGSDQNDALVVALNKTYAAGEVLTLIINYHTNWVNQSDPNNIGGSFGKGLRFFEPTTSIPIKRKQLWSMGEAEGNRYWFPCYDAPGDLRTTELTATIDKDLTVISNGDLLTTTNNPDGTHTFHYKTSQPYPNYLTTVVVGEYMAVKQQYKDITLQSFCYPDEKAASVATTVRLPDMVKFFSTITGIKYPYKNYSQIMVQDFPFPGMTGQNTVSTVSDNMIDDYRTHADFFYLWDGVEADALAAQWFGNLIAVKDWSHSWLIKSFARYLDGLYTDYKNGHDEFLMWYLTYDGSVTYGDWDAGYRHPIVTQHFDNLETFVGDNYARYRGSMVLRMLRKQLGEKKWWKVIQFFVKNNAHKSVVTKDFQCAVEMVTGQNADWFFEQWIYKMGHPIFEVTKTYSPEKKELLVTVKQTQKIDEKEAYPQTVFFKGKMEIEIDAHIETIWIAPQFENTYRFIVTQNPKLVNIDFESTWIKEIKFEKSLEEWLYQCENSKDILARNSAIGELVQLAKKESTASLDKEKIYAALRAVIESKVYWRLKTAALAGFMKIVTPAVNTQPVSLDEATIAMLQHVVKKEKSWVRTSAITLLGMTRNPQFINIYINALNDESERVIAVAAVALGKTKSPQAFDILVPLKDKPSWKNQSLMSALNGLKELGDPRGATIALQAITNHNLPRWFLGNGWDYPFVAAQTLAALGKGQMAYPIIFERFKKSIEENDINDIFSNVLLITTLAHPKGQEVFALLKAKFKNDTNAMAAVNGYEEQFKTLIKNNN